MAGAGSSYFCSNSSTSSIQCVTGVSVPACRCVMQPMLAETIRAGRVPSTGYFSCRWPSLRSRSVPAMPGFSTE